MARIVDGLTASAKAGACRSFCSRKAAARGSTTWRKRAATRSASIGRLTWRDARAAVKDRRRCRAISIRPACMPRPSAFAKKSRRVLASYGHGHGHVFNLGHGIHPQIPPEHAGAMIQAVHELSPQYHRWKRIVRVMHPKAIADSDSWLGYPLVTSGLCRRFLPQLIAQRAAQNFADVRLRQLLSEVHMSRDLVARELCARVIDHLLLG